MKRHRRSGRIGATRVASHREVLTWFEVCEDRLQLDGGALVANDDFYPVLAGTALTTAAQMVAGPKIYASAKIQTAGGGGISILNDQFIGARFHLTAPATVGSIAGTLGGDGTVFGAVVALSGPSDMPDSVELTTPDVLSHALVPTSVGRAELKLNLSPGWYAIVFGTGKFGATGTGYIGPSFGDDVVFDMISNNNGSWHFQPTSYYGFALYGPGTSAGVLSNDSVGAAAAELVAGASHGALNLAPSGTFTYVPEAGFSGVDTFTYLASADGSQSNTATVRLVVGDVVPRANADDFTTEEDTTLSVPATSGLLANDSGDGLSAHVIIPPIHGTLSLEADGSFDYTPSADFTGSDSFFYVASGDAGASGMSKVTIGITPQEDEPRAHEDRYVVTASGTFSAGYGEMFPTTVFWTEGEQYRLGRANILQPEAIQSRASTGPIAVGVDRLHNQLYYSLGPADYRLQRSNLDGSGSQLILSLPASPPGSGDPTIRDLAIDARGGKLYLAVTGNSGQGSLWRANLDGSSPQKLLTFPDGYHILEGIDLDLKAGKVYLSDANNIFRCNLDGTGLQTVVANSPTGIYSISLDVAAGKLYWLDVQSGQLGIKQADFDGSHQKTIFASLGTAYEGEIAVDSAHQKIYWTDNTRYSISRVNTDGSGYEVIAEHARSEGIALDALPSLNYQHSVLANDIDADANSLTAILVDGVQHGSLVLNADGSFDYTPAAGYAGSDNFTYRTSDGNLLSAVATVTIEISPGQLSVGNVQVLESDPVATFVVSLASAVAHEVRVVYQTVDGTAIAGSDYVSSRGTLTFLPGVTSQSVVVPIIGDSVHEPTETFRLSLRQPAGTVLNDDQAIGTIVDEDAPPSISINNTQVTEGNSGQRIAEFVVTLSKPAEVEFTVVYDTSNRSATAGQDYVASSDTLTFAPGQMSQPLHIAVLGDTIPEANETFQVDLRTTVYATINDGRGIGTIIDDDLAGPRAVDDFYDVVASTVLSVPAPGVLGNDARTNQAVASVVTSTRYGILALNANGSFLYSPNQGYVGEDRFTYKVIDHGVASSVATVMIDVRPMVGQAMIIVGDHNLLANTPGQTIEIYVSGGSPILGLDLFAQVGDGGPERAELAGLTAGTDGPSITAADLQTGTIFSGNVYVYPTAGIPQVIAASIVVEIGDPRCPPMVCWLP